MPPSEFELLGWEGSWLGSVESDTDSIAAGPKRILSAEAMSLFQLNRAPDTTYAEMPQCPAHREQHNPDFLSRS
jgi:hypothetical protein